MNFVPEFFIQASCSRFRSLVHHVVRDVKVDNNDQSLFILGKKTMCIKIYKQNMAKMTPQHSI